MPRQKIKCLASSNLLEQFWEKQTLRLVFIRLLELLKTIKWLVDSNSYTIKAIDQQQSLR